MKVIIAGSRTINNTELVESLINSYVNCRLAATHALGVDWKEIIPMTIVSGGAQGVDFIGEMYAKKKNIDLVVFPADWEHLGKKAGIIRNCQMGDYADALLAVWDGKSRGTKHMIEYMVSLGKPMYVEVIKNKTS